MKKRILVIFLVVFSVAWGQNPRQQPTKFYPGLITLNNTAHVNEVQSVMAQTYDLSPNDALVLTSTTTDELGYTHTNYQHFYKGIRVEGSNVVAHAKSNFIQTFSGGYHSFGDLSPTAKISENSARNAAIAKVNARLYAWQAEQSSLPVGQLVFFTKPNTTTTQLAYKFDIHAYEPIYRAWVYVDAQTGEVLFENKRIHHTNVNASGNSLYNGNVGFTAHYNGTNYHLHQTSSGNGIQTYNLNNGHNYSNATNFTSSSATSWSDATAVQAHWGAQKTYAYFFNAHSRNSYDGNGAVIKSYVHCGNNLANAFWDGIRMTYGDGDGGSIGPVVALDVVAHELAHAVTEYSADLYYWMESGALNESFSDIFGEAVEKYVTGSNNWKIGSQIGTTIRNMKNPKALGDPDTYLGTNWYIGYDDEGGVHWNSGVQNKWFYILSEGETGTNDLGNNYSVTGISTEKAAKIAYRNLTVYLNMYSGYHHARSGAIQSAIDLYGAGSPEVIATTNAWYAVGVGDAYGTGLYCPSFGISSSFEWIENVTVCGFSNTSGPSGYSNFTNKTVNVTAGKTYSVSLKPQFVPYYNDFQKWKIWIDFNADNDFNDAGEEVFATTYSNNATVTGSITIPSTAIGTTTRMRVSMKKAWSNSLHTPCQSFDEGEVEDYTISIGAPDSIPPSAPTMLFTTGHTHNSINISWSASADNFGVTGYEVYANGTLAGTTTATTYSLKGLAEGTLYNIYVVAKDAACNSSAASNTVSVTTKISLLLASHFENGWDGWADGGADCERYFGVRSPEGNYSIQLRDDNGIASAMTSPALNLSSYNRVKVEFHFQSVSLENNEDFQLRYFDGSTWQTVVSFVKGPDFVNNFVYVASVTLKDSKYNFPTDAKFRFRCDASGPNDLIYIDSVTIRAFPGAPALMADSGTEITIEKVGKSIEEQSFVDDDLVIYPNPTSDVLYLEAANMPKQVSIISLTGQVIKVFSHVAQGVGLDVTQLSAGTYILAIQYEDQMRYERFVKL